jgi:hypothetical protein
MHGKYDNPIKLSVEQFRQTKSYPCRGFRQTKFLDQRNVVAATSIEPVDHVSAERMAMLEQPQKRRSRDEVYFGYCEAL